MEGVVAEPMKPEVLPGACELRSIILVDQKDLDPAEGLW